MSPGDILGHEAMGVVERSAPRPVTFGSGTGGHPVQHLVRTVLHVATAVCKASVRRKTQNRDQGTGAALFGYSKLYGEVAGGQADTCGCRRPATPHQGADEGPDDRYVYLSDVLPTAWQAWTTPRFPTTAPWWCWARSIGSMACRIAAHRNRYGSSASTGCPNGSSAPAAMPRRDRHAQRQPPRRGARPDRRPRCRLGARRRGNGGPRLTGRRIRPDRSGIPPPRRPGRDAQRRDGPFGRAARRSHWCAAAEPSRSAVSTAGPPTRST